MGHSRDVNTKNAARLVTATIFGMPVPWGQMIKFIQRDNRDHPYITSISAKKIRIFGNGNSHCKLSLLGVAKAPCSLLDCIAAYTSKGIKARKLVVLKC